MWPRGLTNFIYAAQRWFLHTFYLETLMLLSIQIYLPNINSINKKLKSFYYLGYILFIKENTDSGVVVSTLAPLLVHHQGRFSFSLEKLRKSKTWGSNTFLSKSKKYWPFFVLLVLPWLAFLLLAWAVVAPSTGCFVSCGGRQTPLNKEGTSPYLYLCCQ